MPTNCELIERLGEAGVRLSEEPQEDASSDLLDGATFVISGTIEGFTREEAQAAIEQRGGKVTGSVSGKTTALVVGESPGASKMSKAEELDVPIVDGEKFRALLEKGLEVLS